MLSYISLNKFCNVPDTILYNIIIRINYKLTNITSKILFCIIHWRVSFDKNKKQTQQQHTEKKTLLTL